MPSSFRWPTKHRVATLGRRVGALPGRPTVLMYHRVAEETFDPWGLAVAPRRFEEQLRWLMRRRAVLPLEELARLHRRRELPPQAVAITFDDGYACNATVAAPLLVSLGAPATVFLASASVEAGEEYWWDDLQRIVFDAPGPALHCEIGGRPVSVDLGAAVPASSPLRSGRAGASTREREFMVLWNELRKSGEAERSTVLAHLRAQSGTARTPRPTHRPMSPGEGRALAETELVQIGAHTASHLALSEWPEDVQRAEIEVGRDRCTAITGRVPQTFAYPYGDLSSRTVEIVRDAGFEAAVTTRSAAITADCDPLQLPRLQVGNWTAGRLAMALGEL